ncbi:MAG: carbon storage regulator [Thioalkalivibrio sp.]
MLVLTRETGDSAWIGENVRVTVVRVKGGPAHEVGREILQLNGTTRAAMD